MTCSHFREGIALPRRHRLLLPYLALLDGGSICQDIRRGGVVLLCLHLPGLRQRGQRCKQTRVRSFSPAHPLATLTPLAADDRESRPNVYQLVPGAPFSNYLFLTPACAAS